MSTSAGTKQRSLMVALLPLAVLYVGAIVLVALTRGDLGGTLQYWQFFVPVLAFISLISGWDTAYARGQSRLFYLLKQLINWCLVLGLLWLLQTQGVASALGAGKSTITLLYLMALASLLIGINMDWKLFFFGAFLGLCAYVLADPANLAILTPIGDRIGIADAQTKPLTMIIVMGAAGFVASFLILIGTRTSVRARRNKS